VHYFRQPVVGAAIDSFLRQGPQPAAEPMADSDSAPDGATPTPAPSTLNQMLSAQAKVWKAEQASGS
jgi:hypothetical protein